MHVRHRISLFMLPLALGVAQAASAAAVAPAHKAYPEYRVTVVGPAGSIPSDINQAGAVVGNTPVGTGGITTRGFVNYGSGYVNIVTPGGTSNRAMAINDKGTVLVNWVPGLGEVRGFTYNRGTRRNIDPIPGRGTSFVDINNAGYILALGGPPATDPFGSAPFAFLRSPGGSYRPIGTLPYDNAINQAEALNNRNQVTGESGSDLRPETPFHAYLWTNGTIRELPDFGDIPAYGLAINDRGQVAGYAALGGFRTQVAAIWTHGRLLAIDPRPASAMPFSSADGINNYGHAVGSSDKLGAYLYRGKRMESLQALIDPKSGWAISFPRAINDAGQIVATGARGGVEYAVRLDPIRPHLMAPPQLESEAEAGPVLK